MTPPRQSGFMRWLQLQPQRAVGAMALVVAVILCGMVAHDLARDHAQQISAAKARNDSLTQLLDEHARQSMRRVELALNLAAQEVQTQAHSKRGVDESLGVRLLPYLPQDGLVASFAVLDAAGQTVASTLTDKRTELPLANDRDFYRAHQEPLASALFAGRSVKSRITGLWIIPVSIRLQGNFNGYLMAAVDPEYFQHLYRSIDMGDDGFVSLLTVQGWAVARWPFNSELAERNWLDSPLFQQHLPNNATAYAQDSGVPMVLSYSALQEYPLVLALGTSLADVLLPWRAHALVEVGGLLLVLLFLGISARILMAQLRRRAHAEAALQLSEISVLKSSLPTLWIGADARILRVNQAACELHGYTEAQMLTLSVPDLNPGMPMDHWAAHWQRLRAARNMRFETTHRRGDGRDVPVEIELNFIEFDGREYNFSFIRDLSVRKQAEQDVQRSAAMLRGAIDAVDEAFVLFDAEDRLVYCNAKYVALYPDLSDVVVPGTHFEDMIRAGAQRGLYRDSVGREEAWIADRMEAHRSGNESRIQKRDDGRVLRVIDRRTPDGNIVGIRVDITEMVRATEEAQEASRYKSQFLANMSHEIRTPMNAILGLLTLLQNTALNPTQRDYASKTQGAAQSLLGLLNDILDFSKVEAGKMELDPQPFRLDHMLRDIAVILSSNVGSKSIEVLFDIDPQVPLVVVADAMRLQQILVNLGGNAIKFTSQGEVVLRVRLHPVAPALQGQQTCIEFAIQDSGLGIAADKQVHIFSGFSQAEASTTRRFGGSGLGLAICKRLVELMGGELHLQSAPDQGSTFSFRLHLPLASVPADEQASRLSIAPMRVLVVDDNAHSRAILSGITRSWSWDTQLADSGAQALAMIEAQAQGDAFPFDLVYLDWQMPAMDGWELARRIRALAAPAMPRIVMLSASPRDSLLLRTEAEQALIDAFLFKPATASALQDAALGRSHMELQPRPLGSSQRRLAGLRILVVEDNLINQQVAEELLTAEGALVALAANGQLGVEAVQTSRPPFDVVLMDIQVPVLDGYGATRKIREELGLQALPIIAMTANAMSSDRLACLAAGMNEHVGKPFDLENLVSVLRKFTQAPSGPTPAPVPLSMPAPPPVEAAVPVSPPLLNLEAALQRLSGLSELYIEIGQEYIRALDAVEPDFHAGVAGIAANPLAAQMHSLKGTSATLGAERLSAHAALLEKRYRDPAQLPAALEQLPALLDLVAHTRTAVLAAIERLCTGQHAPADAGMPVASAEAHARAIAHLQTLRRLLAASDLAVLDRFENAHGALDAVPATRLVELQQALQRLDLPAAATLCAALLAELGDD